MTSPRHQQALDLVERIQSIIDAVNDPDPLVPDGLQDAEKITVTIDPTLVPSGSRHGIVLVALPTLSSPNFAAIDVKWEVHVIAGPADNWIAAWDRIDSILQVLFDGNVNIDSAEPANYPALNGPPIPAYTLTLNE